MKAALKWVGIIGGGLVVLIILILLVAPLFIDENKFKPLLENKVSEATGRPFTVGDDVRFGLFPMAYVAFSDLKLGNPSGFGDTGFVSLKSFEIQMKLLPLLSRNVQIKRFILSEPHIFLIKSKSGATNWSVQQPPAGGGTDNRPKPEAHPDAGAVGLPIESLEVDRFEVRNGSLTWIDQTSGAQKTISDLDLALNNVSFEQPVQVSLSARVDGHPVSFSGSVGPVGKGFSSQAIPLDLTLKALSQLNLTLKGTLAQPADNPGLKASLVLAEFSPRRLLSELGENQTVATADPNVLKRASLTARIIADTNRIELADAVLKIDDSRLDLALKMTDFSRPQVRADLKLDQMNIDRYLPPDTPTAEGPPDSGGAPGSGQKTDYEPLRRLDLEARLTAGRLYVAKTDIRDAEMQLSAKNGVIQLKPFKCRLYEGRLTGSADLNVNRSTPTVRAAIAVDQLQVGPLLRDQTDKDLLEGVAKANLNLSFSGDQAVTIKNTLNGEGLVTLRDGAVKGVDLAGMVRNVKAAFKGQPVDSQRPRTDFTELTSPFTIKNGVYHTADTSLSSPFLRVTVAGRADLVRETLDLRVEPKVVGTLKGQGDTKKRSGILVPINVTGSFAEPKYEPDLKAVAAQQLEKQVFESDKAKELFEKEELKPYEDTAKKLLKGLLD